MNKDIKNILSKSNKKIADQELMKYLEDQLSKSDSHELEKSMADDTFVNDAVEGLQQFGAKKDMNAYVRQLNKDLHQYLSKKKKRRQQYKWNDQVWIYLTIAIILVLIIICYVVIRKVN